MNSHLPHYQKQQGFVLVLTISLIAIAFMASSFVAKWIDDEVKSGVQLTSSLQQSIDRYSTLSTIIYLAATHPTTYAGLAFPERQKLGYTLPVNEDGDTILSTLGNELRLDNRLYKGIGDSLFQIQDEAGLISVNTLTTDRLTTLFAMVNIERKQVIPALAKLRDYIDVDSDYRPNGAEIKQYTRANYPKIGNHRLRTPEELASVLGWRSIMSEAQFNKIADFLTATPVVPININSAPKASLLVIGLTPPQVKKVITFRESQPVTFANISALLPSTHDTLDVDIFQYYASRSLRVNILSGGSGRNDQYHLEITTQIEHGKPWHIRYKKTHFLPANNKTAAKATGKALFNEL